MPFLNSKMHLGLLILEFDREGLQTQDLIHEIKHYIHLLQNGTCEGIVIRYAQPTEETPTQEQKCVQADHQRAEAFLAERVASGRSQRIWSY
jgi:hypothetical protein